MLYLIFSLYAVFLITFVLMYFFIVYHLLKFSINTSFNRLMLPFFITISAILLFSNILLFFSVDWNGILEQIF